MLVGISRSGKTPTSLYLAMQFGLRAANYPLTEDDLDGEGLPKVLKPYKNKIFGLLVDADRLAAAREHDAARGRGLGEAEPDRLLLLGRGLDAVHPV